MTYELSLENYSGPLEKLLELVEGRKLEITEISLAKVTDEFLKYVKGLEKVETPFLADFIVVASRLILIKSKSLLPDLALTAEEEGDIKDLERRLKLYQELKPAMKVLARLWKSKERSTSRPYFLHISGGIARVPSGSVIFHPGENLTLETLVAGLSRLFEAVKNLELEGATLKEKMVSVEEKIKELVNRLLEQNEINFKNVVHAKKPVSEIVAFFLAILHLAHEQRVHLEQAQAFSDIIIRRQEMHL